MSKRERYVIPRGRYFFVANAFLLQRLTMVVFPILIVLLFLEGRDSSPLMLWGTVAAFGIFVITSLILLANQRRVTCPLCKASYFSSRRALSRGKKVPRVFGSAKIPLALALLTFPKVIRCAYCAERVKLVRTPR